MSSSSYGLPTPPHSNPSAMPGSTTCWLLDTRPLWPGSNIAAASGAAKALALISLEEQRVIMNKMFIADARMSLASALLKRLWISQTLDVPWRKVRMGRRKDPKHGKPCAIDERGNIIEGIDFNVSHQNGLVALVGWDGRPDGGHSSNGPRDGQCDNGSSQVTVGVDLVCVNERDDYRTIDAEGFDGWVDLYESVFSNEERWSMKFDLDYLTLLDGTVLSAHDIGRHDRCIARHTPITVTTPAGRRVSFSSELLIEAKLRRFYTYFCYKEAYIKLSGEALLAPWIKELEFFNVRSPKPGTPARCSKHGVWGEEVDDVEVLLHGQEVDDVRMKIQAFEESFMLSAAIQGDVKGIDIPAFKEVDLESDIMRFAERHFFQGS